MIGKKNSGVTIIEILISIAIIGIVLILLFTLLVQIRREDSANNIQSNFIINQSTFIKKIEEDMVDYGVKSIGSCTLADVNISNTVVSGYENRYRCVRIEYAADYLKDKVGFLLIYNYYTKYENINGSFKGKDPSWIIQYVRGSYSTCYVGQSPKKSTWRSSINIMKEIPAEVDVSDIPYIKYTAVNNNKYNAASLVIPIINLEGEHYDISLSFAFKDNKTFKCDNAHPNRLSCQCLSGDALCNTTYSYSDRCS